KNESGNGSVILNEQQAIEQNSLVQSRATANFFQDVSYSITPRGVVLRILTDQYVKGQIVDMSVDGGLVGTSQTQELRQEGTRGVVEFTLTHSITPKSSIIFYLKSGKNIIDSKSYKPNFTANSTPDKAILNPVKDTDEYISGTVKQPSVGHVVAIQGGQKIRVNSNGTFEIPISKQQAGTVLTVYSYHDTTNTRDYSTSTVTVEGTEVAPTAPEVNEV
ncbi:hypothetical protein COI69_32595, partial [Bacillus cereus]